MADENAPDAAFPERVQTGYRSRTRDLAPSKDSWFLHLEGPQGVSGPYRVKNTPVVAGSETVWVLILHEDSAFEIDRRLLVPGRDYRFEARTGTLWLTWPLPGYNSDRTRNIIAVHYRTAETGVGGAGSGARVAIGSGTASPVGISWQRLGEGNLSTVGIDGSVPVGDTMTVDYELATQNSGAGSGTAAQVEWRWRSDAPTDVSATLLHVDGTLSRTPGSSLAPGTEARVKLDHRLDERLRLGYTRIYRNRDGASARHEDRLSLSALRNRFQHRVELKSSGDGVLLDATRSTSLQLGTEWFISGQQSLRASGRIDFGNAATKGRLVLPDTLGYRLALSEDANLEVAYEAGRNASSSTSSSSGHDGSTPRWIVSVGTHRDDRPNVYGSYRMAAGGGAGNELVVGLRHAWNVTPHLRLGLNAEQTAAGTEEGRTALLWLAGYTGVAQRPLTDLDTVA